MENFIGLMAKFIQVLLFINKKLINTKTFKIYIKLGGWSDGEMQGEG